MIGATIHRYELAFVASMQLVNILSFIHFTVP